jgi:hypothetical protein
MEWEAAEHDSSEKSGREPSYRRKAAKQDRIRWHDEAITIARNAVKALAERFVANMN